MVERSFVRLNALTVIIDTILQVGNRQLHTTIKSCESGTNIYEQTDQTSVEFKIQAQMNMKI